MTEERADSLPSWYHPEMASYKTLLYALRSVPYTSNGTPWNMVPGIHGTHCKHCSFIPLLVFNNNLALLRCGYMCAGTLVHICKHLSRESNNNKRCQLIICCVFCNSGRMDGDYDKVIYMVYICDAPILRVRRRHCNVYT